MAIDGVVLDVPDTAENNEEFDHSSGGKGEGAFPAVRVVGLAECGTHAIVAATFGPWSTGERTLTPQLLPSLSDEMIVLADRGFYSYKLWTEALQTGAALVFRVGDNMVLPVLEAYPDGSYRSVLLDPRRQSPIRKLARRRGEGRHGDLSVLESSGLACRVVEYSIESDDGVSEVTCLITSIIDPESAPSYELAALYHERWEFELSLREIEIYQMGHGRVLRSNHHPWSAKKSGECSSPTTQSATSCTRPRTPRTWTPTGCHSSAAFVSYAVRQLTRRDFPPEQLYAALATAVEEIVAVINPTRRHRTYPRVVKRHFAKYHKIKRLHHRGATHDPPKIHIYAPAGLT